MGISNLNEQEKNLLMQLSYIDLPKNIFMNGSNVKFEDVINQCEKYVSTGNENRYKNITNYIKEHPESNLKDLELVGYENHNYGDANNSDSNSGLVAYAFKDSDGNGTAIYRGSETSDLKNAVADWGSNVVTTSTGEEIEQQRQALDFYNKYVRGLNGEKILLGHSKGGNLASYVYVNNLDDTTAYVINAQPLYWWNLTSEQQEALKGDKYTFVVIDGDFVNALGISKDYIDKYIKNNNSSDGFFGPHYEYSAKYDKFGNAVIEDNPYDNYWGQGIVGKIMPTLITNINQIFNHTVLIDAFIDTSLKFIKYISEDAYELANGVRNFFMDGVKKIKAIPGKLVDSFKGFFASVKDSILRFIKGNGKKASSGGSYISPLVVDISRVNYYVDRLNSIKYRIAIVNDSLSRLFYVYGETSLRDVIYSREISSGSYEVNKCIKYLKTVSEKLDNTERLLNQKAKNI